MTTNKLNKKPSKKELETKRLRKLWRSTGYHKHMPFGNFRILTTNVKNLPNISSRCEKEKVTRSKAKRTY